MAKSLLLYSTIIIGCLFLIVPDKNTPMDFFILSDMKLYPASYIYFLSEKLIPIILAYIIANEAKEYRFPAIVFFWLCVADLLDYVLSYGQWNISVGTFPITFNIVKSFVFGVVILNELWKRSTGT